MAKRSKRILIEIEKHHYKKENFMIVTHWYDDGTAEDWVVAPAIEGEYVPTPRIGE